MVLPRNSPNRILSDYLSQIFSGVSRKCAYADTRSKEDKFLQMNQFFGETLRFASQSQLIEAAKPPFLRFLKSLLRTQMLSFPNLGYRCLFIKP